VQYAGQLSKHHTSLGIDEKRYEEFFSPSLSEPRLVYTPMSLALLINMVFHQFPDDKNDGIRNTSEWRKVVRQNEKFLFEPYFKDCHNFLNNPRRDNKVMLLTSDFCYGR
jgi:hypothetical protein